MRLSLNLKGRPLALLLIPLQLWMVTWLVTDIHPARTPGHHIHPLFSLVQVGSIHAGSVKPKGQPGERAPHASGGHFFCSFDHGGHVGAMAPPLVSLSLTLSSLPEPPPRYAFSLVTHTAPPPLRPPKRS